MILVLNKTLLQWLDSNSLDLTYSRLSEAGCTGYCTDFDECWYPAHRKIGYQIYGQLFF